MNILRLLKKFYVAHGVLCLAISSSVCAATWSDTSMGWRYGTQYAEPFKNHADGSRIDISKYIFNLTHASGYEYGSNYFNADLLQSDDEPSQNNTEGTQEAYVVYRHTLNMSRVFSKDFAVSGVIRDYGLTAGFDWNTKNDVYSSKKRMWVAGPTIMFDVPGFLNLSVLALFESNQPGNIVKRYHYNTHPAVVLTWGIPISKTKLSFEGFAQWIDDKGKDEYGGATAEEINIDAMLMYDFSEVFGQKPKTFRIGAEYQYWKNKFGNDQKGAAGDGATASTPMIRMDYHF